MARSQSNLLHLTELAERINPATLNLTSAGASAMAAGAIVQQVSATSYNASDLHPFVRMRDNGDEQGYNTDHRPVQFDERPNPNRTHSIQLSEVPLVTQGGVNYREFILDINQKHNQPYLSVDEVRIYVSNNGNLSGYNASTKKLGGKTAIYDLDAAGNVSIKLNANLNQHHKGADMKLLVPAIDFNGVAPDKFIYLYSRMGQLSGAHSNSSGEQWSVRTVSNSPPPVQLGSISGRVFVDLNGNGVYEDADGLDYGFGGAVINLTGINDLGQTVNMTTTAADDGTYNFTGLRPGTYSLFEETPEFYTDGLDAVGSLGGTLNGDDGITGINLTSGANGVDYNFGEHYFDNN